MTNPTETRESLLLRLADPGCKDAWDEFSVIYRPMILRLARRCGLQNDDAEDVAQQVMIAVSKAIRQWQKDSCRGRFRGWLTTVTKNAVRNAISRRPRERATGDSEFRRLIESAATESELDTIIEAEYLRSVLREASRRVQSEFEAATWKAFWTTTMDDVDVSDASTRLAMTVGAIYSARSRVMRRLQTVALELTREESSNG